MGSETKSDKGSGKNIENTRDTPSGFRDRKSFAVGLSNQEVTQMIELEKSSLDKMVPFYSSPFAQSALDNAFMHVSDGTYLSSYGGDLGVLRYLQRLNRLLDVLGVVNELDKAIQELDGDVYADQTDMFQQLKDAFKRACDKPIEMDKSETELIINPAFDMIHEILKINELLNQIVENELSKQGQEKLPGIKEAYKNALKHPIIEVDENGKVMVNAAFAKIKEELGGILDPIGPKIDKPKAVQPQVGQEQGKEGQTR